MGSKLSVIYDMTYKCPWNCPICCMGATSCVDEDRDELTLGEKKRIVEKIAEAKKMRQVRIDRKSVV